MKKETKPLTKGHFQLITTLAEIAADDFLCEEAVRPVRRPHPKHRLNREVIARLMEEVA